MFPRSRPTLSAVMAAVITLAWSASPASAQTEPAPRPAAVRIALPAQPLGSALNELARQFGLQLMVHPDLVAGKPAPAVSGDLGARQALDLVLAGSGLVATVDGALVIVKTASGASAPTTLPPVPVKATTQAADGSVSDGYRSTRSSIGGFTDQALLDTPFTVKVLPAPLLANQNIDTVADLFRIDASVTSSAASAGLYSSPLIRGMGLDNFSNYRLNGMMLINLQQTGLETKERVEILKGLSALQAGFASPGGVINYVSKRPTAGALNEVEVSVNQYGNAKLGVDLSRRTGDKRFGLRVNAGYEEIRSFVHDVKGDRRYAALAADWNVTDDTTVQLDLEHEHREQGMQPVVPRVLNTRLPSVDARTFLGQDWARLRTDYTLVDARVEHFLNAQWSLVAEANWMQQKRLQNTISIAGLQENGDATVYNFWAPGQDYVTRTAKLTVNGNFDTGPVKHALAFGLGDLAYRWSWPPYGATAIGTTNIHQRMAIAEPANVEGESFLVLDTKEQAFFFQDVMSFGEAWQLHVGGRHATRDQMSYISAGVPEGPRYKKDIFSPSLAVVFKPAAHISTYLSYAEGLEQGGIAPEGTTNEGSVLKPLVNRQLELGTKAELGGLLAEVALFENKRVAEYTDAANTYVQNGRQRYRGLDLSLSGRIDPEWVVFGSALLLDARLQDTGDAATDGNTPAGVPKHRVALVAEYAPQAWREWTFSGNWSRTGKRPVTAANTGEDAPGYDLFGIGARLATRFNGTTVTWRLNVDNLFDKAYWANANTVLTNGAPRTFSLNAKIGF